MKKIILSLIGVVILISCDNSNKEKIDFRDLNKNDQLDVNEDATQSIEARIYDLLAQMTIKEKAGLMFNAISGVGMGEGIQRVDSLISKVNINHLDMPGMATAKQVLEHNNILQKIAENTRLGIPITFYSDPRHGIEKNKANAIAFYETAFEGNPKKQLNYMKEVNTYSTTRKWKTDLMVLWLILKEWRRNIQ